MKADRESPIMVILATALAPLIWGSTYLVTTEFLPPGRPFTAALLRVLPAGLLLLAWTREWPRWRDMGWLLVLSILNIAFFQAMLFVSAKVSQLALLPQGKVEAARRAKAMVAKMDELGFGNCTNTRACEVECPKQISVTNIARMNREYLSAKFKD